MGASGTKFVIGPIVRQLYVGRYRETNKELEFCGFNGKGRGGGGGEGVGAASLIP